MREFTLLQKLRMAFLAGRYATAKEIAADHGVNCSPEEVKFFLDRSGLPPPPSDDAKLALRCEISRDLADTLDLAAIGRKIGRCDMAEAILETVLSNALVAAVMDDGVA